MNTVQSSRGLPTLIDSDHRCAQEEGRGKAPALRWQIQGRSLSRVALRCGAAMLTLIVSRAVV